MPLPDPSSIDPAKSFVVAGETFKGLLVVYHAVMRMTNNSPNTFRAQTVNVCIQNTIYKMDVIGTDPRLGI